MSPQARSTSLRRSSSKVGLLVDSGRSAFRLGAELKKRGIFPFPLLPSDVVPLDTQVLIVSREFEKEILGCRVIVWTEDSCLEEIVDKVVFLLNSEGNSTGVVIGVDPGKEIGVAVVADDRVLKTDVFESVNEAIEAVVRQASALTCSRKLVRIGSGGQEYGSDMVSALRQTLPEGVEIERVEEWGTSRHALFTSHSRKTRNVASATAIALRKGTPVPRGKTIGNSS